MIHLKTRNRLLFYGDERVIKYSRSGGASGGTSSKLCTLVTWGRKQAKRLCDRSGRRSEGDVFLRASKTLTLRERSTILMESL